MDSKVFVSYSRKDTQIVRDIVSKIDQELGIQCWIDLKGIESSTEFRDVIIKAIDNAEIVLFMLSDNSMASPFAKKEILYAKDTKRIVTICLGDTRPIGWFKFEFAGVDYIRATNADQMNKLFLDLSKWLGIEYPRTLNTIPSIESDQETIKHIVKKIKIKAAEDCIVYIDEEEVGRAESGKLLILEYPIGDYCLRCVTGSGSVFDSDIELQSDKLIKPVFVNTKDNLETNIIQQNVEEVVDNSYLSLTDEELLIKASELFFSEQFDEAIEIYKKLSDNDNSDGMLEYGYLLYEGDNIQRNKEKAFVLYNKALNKGNSKAYLYLSKYYLDEGNETLAYEYLKQGFIEKESLSWFFWGKFYEEKREPENAKALDCYEKALSLNPKKQETCLIYLFMINLLELENYDQVETLFKKYLAIKEDSVINCRLGIFYLDKKDTVISKKYIQRALELSKNVWQRIDSLFLLAIVALEEGNEQQYVDYLTQANKLGEDHGVLLELAKIYGYGFCVEKDFEKAKKLLEKSLLLSNTVSEKSNTLTVLYWVYRTSGDNVNAYQSLMKAISFKATDDTSYALGDAYQNGIGVEINNNEAFGHYLSSAKQNNRGACYVVATYYQYNEAFKNPANAFYFFKKGYDLGDTDCTKELANCYMFGLGTSQNVEKALELCNEIKEINDKYEILDSAANNGIYEAMTILCDEYLGPDQPFENFDKRKLYLEKLGARNKGWSKLTKLFGR